MRYFLQILCSIFTVFAFDLSGQRTLPRCGSISPQIENLNHTIDPASYPREEIVIPIVFHVIAQNELQDIPDEVLESQIDILNEDYNGQNNDIDQTPDRFRGFVGNAGIRFCLAKTAPNGNTTNGIIRKSTTIDFIGSQRFQDGRRAIKHDELGGSSAWDPQRYLNVWIGDRNDFIGDATFPVDETVMPEEDGIVLKFNAVGRNGLDDSFNLGRTLTHEIGHYLNLLHLHGSQTGCNNAGDLVDDTPRQEGPYFGCDDIGQSSCGSDDMDTNFMQFRNDACLQYFTKGQVARMIDALFTYRLDLINSGICNTTSVVPPHPLRVAQIQTMSEGVRINLNVLNEQNYGLELFDMSGRRVWSTRENASHRYEISGATLTGIYILVLDFENSLFSRKILIP